MFSIYSCRILIYYAPGILPTVVSNKHRVQWFPILLALPVLYAVVGDRMGATDWCHFRLVFVATCTKGRSEKAINGISACVNYQALPNTANQAEVTSFCLGQLTQLKAHHCKLLSLQARMVRLVR